MLSNAVAATQLFHFGKFVAVAEAGAACIVEVFPQD
jgi:hypothetical protein